MTDANAWRLSSLISWTKCARAKWKQVVPGDVQRRCYGLG